MTSDISLHLAEILTSRLCHDLITPIGAINTGLELFSETPSDHLTDSTEILNLILHSAQTAAARVSFFRAAFGRSGDALTLGEARDLLENYFMRSKLTSHWKGPFQSDLTLKGWGRLLLNASLWMSECAPRGGTLHISFSQEDPVVLSFLLKAEPLLLHQGTLETLEGQSSLQDLTPRTVPCYLIHLLLEEKKGKLTIHQNSPSELLLEVRERS
ncbi:MAG: hypothetical protein HYX35_02930 [Proteobacteria bacterium]|nr:hypothetical protein [Pseudomonadota bacterium]